MIKITLESGKDIELTWEEYQQLRTILAPPAHLYQYPYIQPQVPITHFYSGNTTTTADTCKIRCLGQDQWVSECGYLVQSTDTYTHCPKCHRLTETVV